jgi:hypothetical protein
MPDGVGKPLESLPKVSTEEENGLEADRKAFEQTQEFQETFLEEDAPTTSIEKKKEIASPKTSAKPATPVAKDASTIEVEKILEEGLGPLYLSLPESAKPKFREKGELAAREISAMVRDLKLQFKVALRLIRDWLLTIPKVNRFFLEQEAKIKVDLIAALIEARKEEIGKRP